MNPFLLTDGYKTGHHLMYPKNTSLVYSNFTPRSNKYAPKGIEEVLSIGQQFTMKYIKKKFDKGFFNKDRYKVCQEIQKEYSLYLGYEYDVSHIEDLWDLGYLPIEVKSLPEGTLVPMGVPILTIYNTIPEFYWLTNFLETLISNLLWKPVTSATIAHQYKKNLLIWAEKTDENNIDFVNFQGHDFSMRGMDSPLATKSSGFGHAVSFLGSDSLPVISFARKYYNQIGPIIHSVPATEHSVMCSGTKDNEIGTFRKLMKTFPTGILSVVSDTWDLWKVITEFLPQLKDEILARDGKLVIRPDSGDPVDIICGLNIVNSLEDLKHLYNKSNIGIAQYYIIKDNIAYEIEIINDYSNNISEIRCDYEKEYSKNLSESKGVIELLWDVFGGTVNEQGYKVLDPHIGAIYGDSITLDRQEEICKRLEAKGFASTNIVLGIGSFTYQYNTRDTFGFAMKATYIEKRTRTSLTRSLDPYQIEGIEIFKDPVTDDGTKKSAKGLLQVKQDSKGKYFLNDQVTWKEEKNSCLQVIFSDGEFYNQTTLSEIRKKVKNAEN